MFKKYNIIYADPPWRFKNYNDGTATRWAGGHYSLMNLDSICKLPVADITAKDCALFLWATYPTLPRAFRVIESWGFTYKTVAFTWIKTNKNGSIFTGMGYWTRSNAEVCLLATRGHLKRLRADVRQVIMSPRGKHSQKPREARIRIVQLLGDLSRIELFAREATEGWDVWGNEVESNIELIL